MKNFSCFNKLKLSFVIKKFKKHGGLEKQGFLIANEFASRGVLVNVLSCECDNSYANSLIKYHKIDIRKWLKFKKALEFDKFCTKWNLKNRSNIVFGMDRISNQTHLRAGNGTHLSYLENIVPHNSLKRKLSMLDKVVLKIEKAGFENRDLRVIFVNSKMVEKEIIQNYRVDPSIIEVVYNGVEWNENEDKFNCWKEKKHKYCVELGLDPSKFYFLFIGNGYKRKGLCQLLKALAIFPCKDFYLLVVGKDRSMGKFVRESTRLGLKNNVRFFGYQDSIDKFYQISDTLIIPSFYDPFANVTVEALSMGLFVVSSKLNGGHEILSNKMGSVIENLMDLDSLSRSLLIAFNHKKTLNSAQSIRYCVKHLDIRQQISKIVDISLENI